MTSPSAPAKPPAAPTATREIKPARAPSTKGLGKKYVAVIGIDRYRSWNSLSNAVTDAQGALKAFTQLGFEAARPPLLNDDATGAALHRLVTDELAWLGTDDSLVVFFAGHGHNVITPFDDGTLTKKGYLIPVDAEKLEGKTSDWVRLDSWLNELTQLPPKHILVILDACHSGIALDPVIRWRGEDVRLAEPFETLRSRRSRRIITSALDDQFAMDSGPVAGHSLFTGCLIEALTGGFTAKTSQTRTTGSELGIYIQRRVTTYPDSKQTPDFGALQFDNRGELIIDLPAYAAPRMPEPTHGVGTLWPTGMQPERSDNSRFPEPASHAPSWGVETIWPEQPAVETTTTAGSDEPKEHERGSRSAPTAPPVSTTPTHASDYADRPSRTALDAAFVTALDRHESLRQSRGKVLSIVTADPMTALTGWATWAAKRGRLTLVTETTGLSATIEALLAQIPWLRTLAIARQRLAKAAALAPSEVDAQLDARSAVQRESWIDDVSRHNLHARVSGWLLSALREPWAQVPDVKSAPVQGADLLAILCELAAPITVLLHHPDPDAHWIERALHTASELLDFLPERALAIAAPDELVTRALRGNPASTALSLARKGLVPLSSRSHRPADQERGRSEQVLHAALMRDHRTAGLFEPNVQVPVHDRERALEVHLVARDALLAVEIDDWYHFRDPQAYHRDRIKDVWLQRAGFFVMRFLAEDIEDRIEQTIDEIALGLAGRRASGPFAEKHQ